jgi:D-threo-aldose 1-dehydrogenase
MGLGTAQLGDLYEALDQDRATSIVDAAWNAGIRYFDTAPHYGLGLAEKRLGVALAPYRRHDYVVSSKVGRIVAPGSDGTPRRRWDFSASGIRRSIDDSLTRLGLDRIDIALIHDPQGHLFEALNYAYPALAKLRADGVVGAIGVGSGDLGALGAFARETDIDAAMIAGRYTLLEQPALEEVIPACIEAGISVLNAGVFNSGLLGATNPSADSKYEYAAVPPELLERARRLADVARNGGSTLPQAALRFAGRDPVVSSVVVGADGPEQLRQNVAMFEDPRSMDDLWASLEQAHLIPSSLNSPSRK